jgi:ATP-dependent Clp protease protease subunit
MEIHLREVLATTNRMAQIIAHHSGQPLSKVEQDIDRDYYLTAQEAKEYGIIDEIIVPRRGVSAELIEMAEQSAVAQVEAARSA